ncbi:MAG: hypothetical protein RQ745_05785 [Longimicrobiales bacterium]|nr:hypothetical protein [Longimicrobiales bacterium]
MRSTLIPIWRRAHLLLGAHATSLTVLVVSLAALDALMLSARPDTVVGMIGASLVIATAVSSVILTADVVAGDFRGGAVQLWLQKPRSPVRYYAARLVDAVLAGGTFVTVLVLAAALPLHFAESLEPTLILLSLPRLLLAVVLISSITFALSAWVNRGAGLGALVIYSSGLLLERDLAADSEIWGAVGTPLLRALLFPEAALGHVFDFAAGDPSPIGLALARITLYTAAWIAFGLFGVHRATTTSRLARAQGE